MYFELTFTSDDTQLELINNKAGKEKSLGVTQGFNCVGLNHDT